MFTALHRKLDVVASHASKLIDRINMSDNVLKGARGDLVALRSSRHTLLTCLLVQKYLLAGARGELVALRSSRYTLLTLLVQKYLLAGTAVRACWYTRTDTDAALRCSHQKYLLTGTTVLACWYKRTDTDAALRCSHRFQTVWENQTGSQFTCFTGTKVQILTLNMWTALRKAVAAATHELDLSADHQVRGLLAFTGTKVQILTLKCLPLRPRRTNSTSLRTTRNACCRLYLLY
jgi:hypothetical protein